MTIKSYFLGMSPYVVLTVDGDQAELDAGGVRTPEELLALARATKKGARVFTREAKRELREAKRRRKAEAKAAKKDGAE